MTEQEALDIMIAPGTRRPGKYREGVIQVWVTSHCDKACYGCTQASNLRRSSRHPSFISPELFEKALQSLGFTYGDGTSTTAPTSAYFGVVGMFGGNPAIHPQFPRLCEILRSYVPFPQRGLWCNNPLRLDFAREMRRTFDPSVSNLNVHLDKEAYHLFKQGWPESNPVGLTTDSRHSPPWVAMKDLEVLPTRELVNGQCKEYATYMPNTEENRWDLISQCDINRHWSAMIGVFRGQLRAWFCEVAGAQSMLHQDEEDYPDTGTRIEYMLPADNDSFWWQQPMQAFAHQARKHCHECGVPLRGYGELAQAEDGKGREQVSKAHDKLFVTKRKGRAVELVTTTSQLEQGRVTNAVRYLQNSNV